MLFNLCCLKALHVAQRMMWSLIAQNYVPTVLVRICFNKNYFLCRRMCFYHTILHNARLSFWRLQLDCKMQLILNEIAFLKRVPSQNRLFTRCVPITILVYICFIHWNHPFLLSYVYSIRYKHEESSFLQDFNCELSFKVALWWRRFFTFVDYVVYYKKSFNFFTTEEINKNIYVRT